MSFRGHVRTKSLIEYGSSWFNHEQSAIKRFLEEEDILYTPCDEYGEYGESWEIDKDDLRDTIRYIEQSYNDDEHVFGNYTKDDAINIFNSWLDETSDPGNFDDPNIIIIDWF